MQKSFLFLFVFGIAQAAVAEPESAAPKRFTVEEVEQVLIKNPHPEKIRGVSKVYSALKKKQYSIALKELKNLEFNPDFQDYYHYLAGEVELGRMRRFAASKSWASAISAGSQARFHFSNVMGANAYTPLYRRSLALLGESEIALGDIYFQKKNRTKAMQHYQSGFERLSQINLLALVPKGTVVNYALLCQKQRTDICNSWEGKLSPLIAKTDEARQLERFTAFKAPAGTVIERTTTTTYKIDLDLQAFLEGYKHYLNGKYEDAFGVWSDLLRQYPRTTIKYRTKFWMARAAQKSKHDAIAETLYREVIRDIPFSYYALLASWHSQIDLSRMITAELPEAVSATQLLTPADVVHIHRAERLIASGAPELAKFELKEVLPKESMPNEFLVYLTVLNHMAGNHLAVFQIFSELSSRNFQGFFSRYGQKLLFPTAYMPEVSEAAKSMGVDPFLILSIMKQESAFNSEAVSSANAYGLMQLIRPTARDLDQKIEIMELLQPEQNIRLGVTYISQMLQRYKGNIILALAAYNAGPHNADRWQRDIPSNLAPEEFIEQITFRETRDYVANILRNYFWYHRRLQKESFVNFQALLQSCGKLARSPASASKARR